MKLPLITSTNYITPTLLKYLSTSLQAQNNAHYFMDKTLSTSYFH